VSAQPVDAALAAFDETNFQVSAFTRT
jgi:hypothetical protein